MATEAITKLAPIEGGLVVLGNPRQMVKQAEEVAQVLVEIVKKQELSQKIGSEEHLFVEAWQFLGHFYGISAKITDVRPVVDELTGAAGFEAIADALLISTGQVISSGRAMCLNNEDNWSFRAKYEYVNGQRTETGKVRVPSFQLASMAQTRAISKVLANVLRFVVVLAGCYSTTPAEDMGSDRSNRKEPQEKPSGRDPERKSSNGNGGPERISDPQRKRLFAIAHQASCPMNDVSKIISSFGFDIAANVTRDKYDAVCGAIEHWQEGQTGGA